VLQVKFAKTKRRATPESIVVLLPFDLRVQYIYLCEFFWVFFIFFFSFFILSCHSFSFIQSKTEREAGEQEISLLVFFMLPPHLDTTRSFQSKEIKVKRNLDKQMTEKQGIGIFIRQEKIYLLGIPIDT